MSWTVHALGGLLWVHWNLLFLDHVWHSLVYTFMYIYFYVYAFCHLVFPLGTVCLDLGGLCPFWGVVHLYYVRSFALRCLYIFICFYIMLLVALAPNLGTVFVVDIAFPIPNLT